MNKKLENYPRLDAVRNFFYNYYRYPRSSNFKAEDFAKECLLDLQGNVFFLTVKGDQY